MQPITAHCSWPASKGPTRRDGTPNSQRQLGGNQGSSGKPDEPSPGRSRGSEWTIRRVGPHSEREVGHPSPKRGQMGPHPSLPIQFTFSLPDIHTLPSFPAAGVRFCDRPTPKIPLEDSRPPPCTSIVSLSPASPVPRRHRRLASPSPWTVCRHWALRCRHKVPSAVWPVSQLLEHRVNKGVGPTQPRRRTTTTDFVHNIASNTNSRG